MPDVVAMTTGWDLVGILAVGVAMAGGLLVPLWWMRRDEKRSAPVSVSERSDER